MTHVGVELHAARYDNCGAMAAKRKRNGAEREKADSVPVPVPHLAMT